MKKFLVTWFNHKSEIVYGENIIDAIVKAGYYDHDIHDIRNFKEIKTEKGDN